MTRDVLIRISGLQAMDGDHDDVEMITTGDYFLKNGKQTRWRNTKMTDCIEIII